MVEDRARRRLGMSADPDDEGLERVEAIAVADATAHAAAGGLRRALPAAALGITRVREVSRQELADAGAFGSAVIAVIVGTDLRMR